MDSKLQQGDRFPPLTLKLVEEGTVHIPDEMPTRYLENRVESDTPAAEQGESGAQGTGSCLRVDPRYLNGLDWRCIGPFRGGRVVAVTGDPQDPLVFYFGATAGGVWKTYDAGTYWENISDGYFKTAAIGAIAVADSDPNVVYVGTGEACLRPDVSHGNGVYKSTDAGKTWTHLGLENTRHIARIRIHPKDPNIVYVAALGHGFGSNRERGVYRSKEGGKTWDQVLFKSERAGAIDLSMDPNNPRILYAAIFQALRQPWNITSGGPDSGLYRSTDGGDTWTDISNNPGLPQGIKGRIGVAVSPARPGRVWALIEAEDGALFRSDDGGETWDHLDDRRDLRRKAWSYTHLFADTHDPETCYVLCYDLWKSTDGGRTFSTRPMPHGDHHDLWIDPRNPDRMIEGSDGGATVTLNGGASWSTLYNQPTASIFHLATDTQFPYRVYGTQMDNSAISVPSRSYKGAIPWGDCYAVGSAESGHIVVRPDDPNIVVAGAIGSSPGGGGNLLRYDHRTGQARLITVWPENQYGSAPKDVKYRFHFTFPIVLSPHDPNVLYTAANVVFRSKDEGTSWEVISPDLTRNDVSKMMEISGGPFTTDGVSTEYTGLIFAFAESPHEPGVLWAGSDDGLVHLSRDDGGTWNNVTPEEMPEWTVTNTIEVSPHEPATAYLSATRYKLNDWRPFLFKTNDYGKTWKKITRGIPEDDFARVIREDPSRRGLLYCGTETGIYVSFDDGASWQPLQRNLPVVPVHDLAVKEDDLIAATHGRSFWILDDLTPLHQITDQVTQSKAHLFKPRPTYRVRASARLPRIGISEGRNYQMLSGDIVAFYKTQEANGVTKFSYLDAGQNPPEGVVLSYYLKQAHQGDVTLTLLDPKGQEIRRFSSKTSNGQEPSVPANEGMNRIIWDMRYPNGREVRRESPLSDNENPRGIPPMAPPGHYQVQLTVEGQTSSQPFEIRKDPRVTATQEDLEAQLALHIQVRDKLSETSDAINRLRSTRQQVEEWESKAAGSSEADAITRVASGLKEKLAAIERELILVPGSNPLNLPDKGLNAKLAALTSVVDSADSAPTRQSYDVFNVLSKRVDTEIQRLQEVVDTELKAFLNLIESLDIPAIVP